MTTDATKNNHGKNPIETPKNQTEKDQRLSLSTSEEKSIHKFRYLK